MKPAFKKYLHGLNDSFGGHNPAFIMLGTFLYWVGWFYFNGGSTVSMQTKRMNGSSKIIFNTFIASSISDILVTTIKPFVMRTYSKVN